MTGAGAVGLGAPVVVAGLVRLVFSLRPPGGSGLARRPDPLTRWLAALSASFAAFVLVARAGAFANIPLDGRMLLPVLVLGLVLVLCYTHRRLAAHGTGARWRWSALALGLLWVLASARTTVPTVMASRTQGLGYANRSWSESGLIAELRRLSPTVIYSNGPDVVYLHTGRLAALLPRVTDPYTGRPDPQLEDAILTMQRRLRNGGAVIAHFRGVSWRSYLLTEEQVRHAVGLTRERYHDSDGVILELAPPATETPLHAAARAPTAAR